MADLDQAVQQIKRSKVTDHYCTLIQVLIISYLWHKYFSFIKWYQRNKNNCSLTTFKLCSSVVQMIKRSVDNKEIFFSSNVIEIVKCWVSYALMANDKLMYILFDVHVVHVCIHFKNCQNFLQLQKYNFCRISFAVCIIDRSNIEEIYGNPQNSLECLKTVIR